MVEFRRSLAASFLFRFFVDVAVRLRANSPAAGSWLPTGHESAAARFERPPARGIQYFSKAGDAEVVGQPERHMAADLQVPRHNLAMSVSVSRGLQKYLSLEPPAVSQQEVFIAGERRGE